MGAIRRHARLITGCAATILTTFVFSAYARWTTLRASNEELRGELERVTKELFPTATSNPTEARKLLEGEASGTGPMPKFTALQALDAISKAIPENIKHDVRQLSIAIEDGQFEMQGAVESIAQTDTIAEQLEDHECFDELTKGRTTPGPGGKGVTYRLEGSIQCPGDEPRSESAKGKTRTRKPSAVR
jgi:general secretion pathway protein L